MNRATHSGESWNDWLAHRKCDSLDRPWRGLSRFKARRWCFQQTKPFEASEYTDTHRYTNLLHCSVRNCWRALRPAQSSTVLAFLVMCVCFLSCRRLELSFTTVACYISSSQSTLDVANLTCIWNESCRHIAPHISGFHCSELLISSIILFVNLEPMVV